MRALFLAEAGGIACKRLRQARLRNYLVDELAYHRMLRSTDEVKILSLYLVHHGIHIVLAHNTLDDISVDHKGRDAVGKAAVYHKIARIGKNRGMQTRHITHEIVKSVSGHTTCGVHINAAESFHDLSVIRNVKIGYARLSETLDLNIAGVVRTYRHALVNDVGDDHHYLSDLFLKNRLQLFKLRKARGALSDLFLHLLSLCALTVSHKHAYLLGAAILFGSQIVCLLNGAAILGVKRDDLVNKRQLLLLVFVFKILLYNVGIFPYKSDVKHFYSSG